ncbi:16S rRNA methyltransferase B [Steroidobacter denitrificans]|uniref:16S rRNA (cytosine(967)-C(5))-methyltransferase n=2 Tax=Steroidobacter denitrificans TaxID=465721 RepID=A0A127F7Q6_STEDE|nr:16S rRNA methyltransferase B [Steroidobacter denitrificans]
MHAGHDRGLLRALSYESLRWYLRLDALLVKLLSRPNQSLAPDVRALSIVGLCQLLHMNTPAHAAIAETVEAARHLGHPRAAGFVNALLRRAQREGAQLLAAVDRDPVLRMAHPGWLVDALREDWGEAAAGILDANNQHPPFWLRVNRLRGTGAQYRARLEAAGMAVVAGEFQDETLLLAAAADVADLPGFDSGDVSVQDAAAQLAARLLAPRAGERILDACAAPGGKTGHLLELQPEVGSLVAIDVSRQRLRRVADNLLRLGFPVEQGTGEHFGAYPSVLPIPSRSRIQLIAADAAAPESWWDGVVFDRILLDVPCSATGVIRRHPDIKLLRRAEDIPVLAERQLQLLQRLWPLLAPGGRLVYASCSALLTETHDTVAAFLASCDEARDITVAVLGTLGFDRGIETDRISGRIPGRSSGRLVGRRIAAGTAGMDGFYYACLEKTKGR